MPYKCKKCGRDVTVTRWPVESGGVDEFLIMSVETAAGKMRDVSYCPTCGNRLMIYDDMEFIKDDEYHREKMFTDNRQPFTEKDGQRKTDNAPEGHNGERIL